jgi:hypothetical protein
MKDLMDGIKSEVECCGDDESSLFGCLQKNRNFLHPNHQTLTDIRCRLIPTFCRGPNSKLDDFTDEKFMQKLEMCLENKRVFDVCDPGMSTARGRLLYEIPESIFQVNIVTWVFLLLLVFLFCFVLFCFVLFCFVLFCFVLLCFVLFCFVLLCFVLFVN